MIDQAVPDFYHEVMTLSQEHWQSLSAADRESAAKGLVASLPTGFSYHTLAGSNAIFTFESAKFVLIPGGVVSLGFDAERPWIPTPEETESWAMTARDYGFSDSIHERACAVTFRPRQVELSPLLVEIEARELGWESTSPEDPEIVSSLKKYPAGFQLCHGEKSIRVHRKSDGSIIAERSVNQTHADLLALLRESGFRFPTSDEWEYVCGGGAPTLFRWGGEITIILRFERRVCRWDCSSRQRTISLGHLNSRAWEANPAGCTNLKSDG